MNLKTANHTEQSMIRSSGREQVTQSGRSQEAPETLVWFQIACEWVKRDWYGMKYSS